MTRDIDDPKYYISEHYAVGEAWYNVRDRDRDPDTDPLGTFNRLENAELFLTALEAKELNNE